MLRINDTRSSTTQKAKRGQRKKYLEVKSGAIHPPVDFSKTIIDSGLPN
jgi:hypothetical protein